MVETLSHEQRIFVDLAATHEQYLMILVPSGLNMANRKGGSLQDEEDHGSSTGEDVGVVATVGALIGKAVGVIGDAIGVFRSPPCW
jgi:hypothetical protein